MDFFYLYLAVKKFNGIQSGNLEVMGGLGLF
jgi:hypothetical protein